MDLKQQILHYYRVDELSLREISRKTSTDRKTITRLINAFEAYIKEHPEQGIDEFLAERPKYKSRVYSPKVLRDKLPSEIDKCLKENDRRRNNGMRKQCLKGKDIHRLLQEKGYNISYSSVCKYIRKKKDEKTDRSKDVYLKIRRFPCDECEFDYQDTLAFMESHRNFFREVDGVPVTMVYDNMRVAVHMRSYGSNQCIMEFSHFIPTLMKKTAAIEHFEGFYQMPTDIQDIFKKHFRDNGKEFLLLVKYAKENDVSYENIVLAAQKLEERGIKSFTADYFKVVLQELASPDEPFREDQKTDAFIEIEAGSEDILTQLENVMEKGTKLHE